MGPAHANDLNRVHERLDELFSKVGDIGAKVDVIAAGCPGCKATVTKHEEAIYGNGKEGVLTRLGRVETGRVDTLSVPSLTKIMAGVGALAGAIGAAIAAVVSALAKGG